MSEVLSQNEIDALLNAVSSGELDVEEIKEDTEKKVRDYDFRNPQKMSKEHLRTLEIIHENFARYMQTTLTGHLRTSTEIKIMTVDQFAYSEFSNAIQSPAFLSIIDFSPLKGQIMIEISNNLVYVIIDRLLGGDGKSTGDFDSFTEIELNLLENVMEKLTEDLALSWENVVELNPYLDKIETNPQFAQLVPPNETIALVTMNIKIGKEEGMMNICIPYIILESVLDRLSATLWFSTIESDEDEENEELLEAKINETKVPVIAELGKTILTVNEIVNLRRGDVLVLDSNGEDIKVNISDNTKFIGTIGSVNKHMAVRIDEILKGGVSDE